MGEVEGPVRTEVMNAPEEILAGRPGVVAARHEAREARLAVGEELERLEASARAAVDLKAKIRREPVRTVGLAAGATFLVLGGPRKVLRRTRSAIFGKPDPLPASMLPEEINRALSALGSDGEQVRGTIEREFAAYLREKAPEGETRNVVHTLTSLFGTFARPIALRAGFRLGHDLFAPDAAGYTDQLARLRGRRPSATRGAPPDEG